MKDDTEFSYCNYTIYTLHKYMIFIKYSLQNRRFYPAIIVFSIANADLSC